MTQENASTRTDESVSPFENQYQDYRNRAEQALRDWLPPAETRPQCLHQAMRHSLDAGGKRLRPVLTLAVRDTQPGPLHAEPAAAAVEALHTYSLIHDDLPCMDNSELRRGKPTCHVAFDESTALLAGDALLTEAFGILSRAYRAHPHTSTELVHTLAEAAGSQKLIGGQMEDLIGERETEVNADRLHFIHASKTAALIKACVKMGKQLTANPDGETEAAEQFGYHVGLAFQIIDDILDATSDSNTLGKTAGLDAQNDTYTYPRLYGLEASREQASLHSRQAIEALEHGFSGDVSFLKEIVHAMENRIH